MNGQTFLSAAGCAAAGMTAGGLCMRILNRVPAAWLCDYGETPGPELNGRRAGKRDALLADALCGAAFFLFLLQYGFFSPQFYIAGFACLPLTLTAFADQKYGIIPDQFVLLLALAGAAEAACGLLSGGGVREALLPPLLGAAAGGGLWLLTGALGLLLFRREAIGFGDVKLAAALGLLCGWPLSAAVFILTVLAAGLHFSVLLAMKKIDGGTQKPLGPYLCAAGIVSLAFRMQMLSAAGWYLSLFR